MLTTNVYLIIAAYAVLFALALTLCSLPLLGILQQEGYGGGALLKWYHKRGHVLSHRYALLSLSLLLLTGLFSLTFSFLGADYADIIAGVIYLGLCSVFIYAFRYALKVPVHRTKRLIRLAICLYVLLFAALFGAGIGLYCAAESIGYDLARTLRIVPIALFPVLLVLFVALAGLIMKAYEVPRSRSLIKKAKRTLGTSACVKVGITGSFGKTSVKYIAAQLLQGRRVIFTPASFNTPIGIAKCVNEGGLDCDIFLAEMGARHVGDIQELCDMVQPTVGVVTGICAQHLESFKSLENIAREKGELARRTERTILGKTAATLKEDALVEGRDFGAEEVELSPEGTSFTLRIGGEKKRVHTKLLGRHAAEDIALAAALCTELGVPMSEICARISALEPAPHRLQRLEGNGVHILDDSYNSNTEGAKNAVEVLKLFGGKKFVVTPGLVELGEMEEEKNEALGGSLAGLDRVILVGETRVMAVRRGYLAAGGREENLTVVPTLTLAQGLLEKELSAGDSVLFLNDLPDKY